MAEKGLKELYIDELKDLYNAENQLLKALPKMAKAATSEELSAGFEEHLEQTRGHVQRLEDIFKQLGESPKGKKCKGMEGLIEASKRVRKRLTNMTMSCWMLPLSALRSVSNTTKWPATGR
jgi:ferritin-like metal-binding protein YciE